MIRRYDLTRSDNVPYSGKIAYVCSGAGTFKVYTGFQVSSAMVSFAAIPISYSDMSSSSSEDYTDIMPPKVYVYSYEDDGFIIAYENIPDDLGYIEVNYTAG